MNVKKSPKEIAEILLYRSTCAVKVGSCIADKQGVFSWGWNSSGPDGLGQCSEAHAILRANRKRLLGATIYVASIRGRNGKIIISKPCENCQRLINKLGLLAIYRDADGRWRKS